MTTTFSITQQSPNREKTYLYPEGDLSGCTAWTAHGATPNWACVDDAKSSPDYTTTYVSMATNIDTTDLYELPNAYINGTIDYVKIYNMVRTVITPQSDLEYYITISPDSVCTNVYYSDLKNLTTGWAKKSYIWTTNPETSVVWTANNIDAMAIGMKANSGSPKVTTQKLNLNTSGAGDKLEHGYQFASSGWEAVQSYSDSSYIYTELTATRESLFAFDNHTTETGTINSVTVLAWVRGWGLGYNSKLAVGLKTGGTEYWDTLLSYGTSYQLISKTWYTNPATGSAWSWAEIDALQAGVQSENRGYCKQVYVNVDYSQRDTTEIDVTQCYAEVAYTPSTTTCFLNMPKEINSNHARNTKMFNFWNGEREVYDHSRSRKSIVLQGTEWKSGKKTSETFYFNQYDSTDVWETTPENMVDGNTGTDAETTINGDTQTLTRSTVTNSFHTDCGVITKVEVYVSGTHGTFNGLYVYPIFDGTTGSRYDYANRWHDITNDAQAPSTWTWGDVKDLDTKVEAIRPWNGTVAASIVYVRVTYTDPAPCCRIQCVRNMGRNGASITLDGFSFGLWAGTYKIKQFGWQKVAENPEVYNWILELEDES